MKQKRTPSFSFTPQHRAPRGEAVVGRMSAVLLSSMARVVACRGADVVLPVTFQWRATVSNVTLSMVAAWALPTVTMCAVTKLGPCTPEQQRRR